MVVADTLEAALRQTLSANEGSFLPFVARPISAAMLVLALVILVWPWLKARASRRWPSLVARRSTFRSIRACFE